MLHIRVPSNDEWKAIPPTRGAIENIAGSEISIIASGYYVHRVPLFSVSCSFRHRRFRDIAISCRRCVQEREDDLSITARTSSRSISCAPVICISPDVPSAICYTIKKGSCLLASLLENMEREDFLWIVIYIYECISNLSSRFARVKLYLGSYEKTIRVKKAILNCV